MELIALIVMLVIYAIIGWLLSRQYQSDYDELVKKDKHAAEAMLQATTHIIF